MIELKGYQVAAIIATITTFMAICAAGIVPTDPCEGTQAYIDWEVVGSFVLSCTGASLTVGAWLFIFGIVHISNYIEVKWNGHA